MTLVDALIRAQSGYRSDVAALVEELKRSDVFAPLAKGGNLPSWPTTLTANTLVTLHNLPSDDGTVWAVLFSSIETLHTAGTQHNWKTDGGPLHYIGFKWDAGIEGMFRRALESGGNAGIVFDVGARSELALNAAEVISIVKGDLVPLVNYAARQPARGNEQVYIGEPAVPPPMELVEAVKLTLSTESAVTAYHLRQVYVPERDVMPHLILDIETAASEAERRRISQRVGEAIHEIALPPPGYLDIAFNLDRTQASAPRLITEDRGGVRADAEIVRQYLPLPPANVLDVSGSAGIHAAWLAQDGMRSIAQIRCGFDGLDSRTTEGCPLLTIRQHVQRGELIPIGEFAKRSSLSIHQLRHYHEMAVHAESPQVFRRLGGLDLRGGVGLALTMVVEAVDPAEQVPLRGVSCPTTDDERRALESR